MSIDAATVIASAVISAVISTGVALATGPTRAARDERGKRAYQARRDVRSAVSEHLAQVKDYRAGIRGSLRRASSLSTLDDALFCASVLRPAADLSPWRRFLVQRRLRLLVGPLMFDLAEARPAATPGGAFGSFLREEFRSWEDRSQRDLRDVGRVGLISKTLAADPDPAALNVLVKQLRWLSAAR